MNAIDNGGPAFPNWIPGTDGPGLAGGMSMRDYAAIKAMQSFMQGAVLPPGFDATKRIAFVATRAYEVADALLKARQS